MNTDMIQEMDDVGFSAYTYAKILNFKSIVKLFGNNSINFLY
jgi:hypothetical protein